MRGAGRAQQCRKAAAGGPLQVALGWGQVQEPAALQLLAELLPGSLLSETGLHVVSQAMLPAGFTLAPAQRQRQQQPEQQQAAQPPGRQGGSSSSSSSAAKSDSSPAPGSLPLLGASPDGLVRHRLHLTAAVLQALQPLLLELQRAGQADPTQAGVSLPRLLSL
jgi:hypothetical protein